MLVADIGIRNKIYELISSGQLHISAPILRLDIVSSNRDYELDKDDILDVFSRYGEVQDVTLKSNGRAYIVFKDIVSAIFAKKCLNGFYMSDVDVRLKVSWLDQTESQSGAGNNYTDLIDYYEMVANRDTGAIPLRWNGYQQQHQQGHNSSENVSGTVSTPGGANNINDPSPHASAANKLTCRFEIQIDNDKEFQVARKIIGAKGCNMKRIIECCNQHIKSDRNANSGELVKLRLRGKGSGFKEGPEKQESADPLHLCISAKQKDVYDVACQFVEELLKNIYDEHKKFLYSKTKSSKPALQIKKIETFPWNKSSTFQDVSI